MEIILNLIWFESEYSRKTIVVVELVAQLCQQEICRNFHHFSPTRHEGAQGLKGSNFVMLLSSFSSSFSKE